MKESENDIMDAGKTFLDRCRGKHGFIPTDVENGGSIKNDQLSNYTQMSNYSSHDFDSLGSFSLSSSENSLSVNGTSSEDSFQVRSWKPSVSRSFSSPSLQMKKDDNTFVIENITQNDKDQCVTHTKPILRRNATWEEDPMERAGLRHLVKSYIRVTLLDSMFL